MPDAGPRRLNLEERRRSYSSAAGTEQFGPDRDTAPALSARPAAPGRDPDRTAALGNIPTTL